MDNNTRKFIVGGNWKCNGSLDSINKLITEVINPTEFDVTKVDIVVAPISVHIGTVKKSINPNVKLAVQNISA